MASIGYNKIYYHSNDFCVLPFVAKGDWSIYKQALHNSETVIERADSYRNTHRNDMIRRQSSQRWWPLYNLFDWLQVRTAANKSNSDKRSTTENRCSSIGLRRWRQWPLLVSWVGEPGGGECLLSIASSSPSLPGQCSMSVHISIKEVART